MKIIDLLNKIANGEEVPKKIKYNNKIYSAKGNAIENFVDYCSEEDEWCFNHYVRYENLNDEVEIIEEKKIPEKLDDFTIAVGSVDESNIEEYIQTLFNQQYEIFNKINSIIDYLKSKGE